jgi:predicted Zn-dependent peptidase
MSARHVEPAPHAWRIRSARLPLAAGLAAAWFGLGPAGPPAASTPPGDGPARAPARRIGLENGLEAVILPRSGAPLVTAVAVVRAGASSEQPGTAGAAHMIEHLLFNGTARRSQEALYADLDARGIVHNAHTGADETTLFMLGPGDELPAILEIEAEMLFASTFTPDKLEKERGIVLNEIARDSAQESSRLEAFVAEALYAGTPCAVPATGTAGSVRSLTREAILAFHRRHYRPGNVTLLVMGDVEMEAAARAVRETFGAVPASPAPEAPGAPDCRLRAEALGKLHARRADAASRHLVLAAAAPGHDSPRRHAASLLAGILGPGLAASASGRLPEGRGRILDAEVAARAARSGGLLRVSATLGADLGYEEAARALFDEIRARLRAPVDPAALAERKLAERVRLALLRDRPHYFGLDRAPLIASRGWEGAEADGREMEAATGEDVARLASGLEDPRSWAVLVMGRDAEAAPGFALAAAPASSPEHVEAPEEGPASPEARAEERAAAPASGPGPSAEAEGTGEDAPAAVEIREVLPNGVVLRVRSDPGSEVFAAALLTRRRNAGEPAGKEGAADLLHRLAGNATGKRGPAELVRDLARIGATVKTTDDPSIPYDDADTSPEFSFIRMETLDAFAGEALALLAEMVGDPALDAASLARFRDVQIERLRQGASRPAERARALLLRAILGASSPLARSPFGTEEGLRALPAADLATFRSSHFAASNLVLAVATSLPTAEVYRAAAATFGKLPGPAPGAAPAAAGASGAPAAPSKSAPGAGQDGAPATVREKSGSAQAYVLLGAILHPGPSEVPPLAAAAAVLSRRMGMDLREKRGLSYALGAGVELLGGGLLLTIRMGTTPAQLEAALAGIDATIEGLRTSPPSREEIAVAVRGEGVRQIMRRLARTNQAFAAGLQEIRSGSPIPAPWEDLAVPAPEAVAAAVGKHLAAARLTRVVLE